MNPVIYREYDIRGVYGEDYSLEDAHRFGQGFGTFLRMAGGHVAVVGRDCRTSSPEIRDATVEGLRLAGVDVLDVGLVPTPVLYFALRRLPAAGGVMITASHNPPRYNGFKVCVGPDTIFGREIQNLRQLVESGKFHNGWGALSVVDILPQYIDHVVSSIRLSRPVRLAADAGNGTAGITAAPILERLGCPAHALYFEPDGNFPHHEPDPTIADNMADLARLVTGRGLELGIGFDGDADRLGVVDEQGRIIWGDMLMVIFAREILREVPGATFIGEVKCSQRMYDAISAAGGRAVMWKTGHSLMKEKLKLEHAELAGEMSGHMFFGHRFFGFDDGVYAACRLIEILSRSDRPLSSYLDDLPPAFSTPEIRVDCPEEIKFTLVDRVREILAADHDIVDIDGVRVLFPDGWGLLRASNTSPMLVLRFEARTEARLGETESLVRGVLDEQRERLLDEADHG